MIVLLLIPPLIKLELAGDTCDTTQDDVSCTFENGHLCAWDFAAATPNHWLLGMGPVGTGLYALEGAALGTGFAYVDSSVLPSPNVPAEMDTHPLPATNTQLSFWYRAFGHGVNSLTLLIEIGGSRYLLWSVHSGRRDWAHVEVDVCSTITHKVPHSLNMKDFTSFSVFAQTLQL